MILSSPSYVNLLQHSAVTIIENKIRHCQWSATRDDWHEKPGKYGLRKADATVRASRNYARLYLLVRRPSLDLSDLLVQGLYPQLLYKNI